VFEVLLHLGEGGAPVAIDIAADRIDALGGGAVDAAAAVAADGDEVGVEEDAEVLGDGGLGEAEGGDELADGALALAKAVEDGAAAGVGEGLEGVGGHGRSVGESIGSCLYRRE
jgi:hypothetical protein